MDFIDDMIIEVKLYFNESFTYMDTITLNRLKTLFEKAQSRIEREQKGDTVPSGPKPKQDKSVPFETDKERSIRIIRERIELDKQEAQEWAGSSVRY